MLPRFGADVQNVKHTGLFADFFCVFSKCFCRQEFQLFVHGCGSVIPVVGTKYYREDTIFRAKIFVVVQ